MRPLPIANPPNPWAATSVEYLGEPPEAELHVFEERGKTIVTPNDSPDVGFRFSVNPYRGCMHACAYCYARPSHQYWGFGAGTDFDRKIIVKVDAPEMLAATFDKKGWKGELILFSGNTDCYQPLEASYRLTRRCLEVCLAYRNPVGVITKSALVRRDVDVLSQLARRARCRATISIPFSDEAMARAIEPYAAAPAARFETIRRLAAEGVSVGVNVAPVIPGLNDTQIVEVLERAKEAGAGRAAILPVRLAAEVMPVFFERLAAAFPDRVGKVTRAVREMRGGKLNESGFGARMQGLGPRWEATSRLFEAHAARLGLATWASGTAPKDVRAPTGAPDEDEGPSPFRRPSSQGELFQD
ncbi:MAG TPA: PA0069 family radical SAM protein [Minicystis sp.]|nr:PA0069 family radical SAM protein [Minicystis sp.]